jgi:hypothetical protein
MSKLHFRSLNLRRCVSLVHKLLNYVFYEVFGLMNHSIQNEVVHHGSIPQIWWNDSIPHISTKQLTIKNEVVMN